MAVFLCFGLLRFHYPIFEISRRQTENLSAPVATATAPQCQILPKAGWSQGDVKNRPRSFKLTHPLNRLHAGWHFPSERCHWIKVPGLKSRNVPEENMCWLYLHSKHMNSLLSIIKGWGDIHLIQQKKLLNNIKRLFYQILKTGSRIAAYLAHLEGLHLRNWHFVHKALPHTFGKKIRNSHFKYLQSMSLCTCVGWRGL